MSKLERILARSRIDVTPRLARWSRLQYLSAVAALAGIAPLLLSQHSADPTAEAVRLLREVKAATGGAKWDGITTWHERGAFHTGDQTGTYETWLDFHRSRLYRDERVTSAVVGALRDTTGWNGKVSWSGDQSGDVCIAESQEARSGAIADTYVSTFAFLFGARMPASITAEGARNADGTVFDVVRVTPRGADAFELWIDQPTHFVRRIVYLTGPAPVTTVFSDFRQVAGLTVAYQNLDTAGNKASSSKSTAITSIEIDSTAPAGIFDPPQPTFSDIHFPQGRDSVSVDFNFRDNYIQLPVSVNGQSLTKFVFDIGSTNTLDSRQAQVLGLKMEMTGLSIIGGRGMPSGLVRIDRIEIGGIRLENQVAATADIGSVSDQALEGIIGYELARRVAVTIDYHAKRITFTKPETFRAPAKAVALPFQFAATSEVLIEAALDGIRGDFQIDTGSPYALVLGGPFADKSGLLARRPGAREEKGEGSARRIFFQARELRFGGLQFRQPDVVVDVPDTGGSGEEHIAGTIGNEILRRFKVTLDYAHRMVYLEKNAEFSQSSTSKPGRSGILKLDQDDSGALVVAELEADGSAAKAGLLKGDRITALNGVALAAGKFDNIKATLGSPGGTEVRLTVTRGSKILDIRFVMQPVGR